MEFRSAVALLLGTLSIAALHALIPSHWLAFAVVGRAQRWPMGRTLRVTALAGMGHVLVTVGLGFGLAFAGKTALKSVPAALEHSLTAGALILLGLYFALPVLLKRSKGHSHAHDGHDHSQEVSSAQERATSTVMGTLVLGMTLSPCLDLLPVYIAASTLSWGMILVISAVMASVTLGFMVGLVWLALHGLERLNLKWLEQNEMLAVGTILIVLGGLLFFL